MLKTAAIVSEEEQLIPSTLSPGPAQKRLALGVVLGLLIVFVLITVGPLSSVRMSPVAAFVPAYATAMLVCDSITAILLFAQFSILRSHAILVIASGYLFTALILIPWILAFPGVFAPTSLIGGLHRPPGSTPCGTVVLPCSCSVTLCPRMRIPARDPGRARTARRSFGVSPRPPPWCWQRDPFA